MHTYQTATLADQHQRRLRTEAEHHRLVRRARTAAPTTPLGASTSTPDVAWTGLARLLRTMPWRRPASLRGQTAAGSAATSS